MALASFIDWGALGDVVLYAFVAAVGVTIVFSLGIVGMVRYDDRRRGAGGGIAWGALALVCALVVAAVVVEAIVIMSKK